MKRLFLILLLFPLISFSQQQAIEANYYYGFFWPHRTTMRHIVNDYAKGFNVAYEANYTNSLANKYYNSPVWGIQFLFLNPGNKKVLGNTYSLVPYLRLKLIDYERFNLTTKLGLGLGYVENTYNRETNFTNTAIGSHINLNVHLNIDAAYAISQNTHLKAGLNFTHLSNGAMVLPNLGLNIPTLNIGINRAFGYSESEELIEPAKDVSPSKNWLVHVNFGMREVEPNSEKLFPNYNLSIEYLSQKSAVNSFSGIVDFFYKSTLSERAKIDTGITRGISSFQLGLMGAYHRTINPIDIYIGMGIYLVDDAKFDGLFYHRLGMRYLLSDNLNLGFSIYSHFAKADHFQLGIGYKIK